MKRILVDNLEVRPCETLQAMYSNIKYNTFHVLNKGKSQLPGIVDVYDYSDLPGQ